MQFRFKYKRIGTFMIDLAIVQMFAQLLDKVLLGAVLYFGQNLGISFSLNDAIALPALLTLYLGALLVFVGCFVGYHWICYRLLGNSLSRYFLGLRVVSKTGQPLTQGQYLTREFEKVVLSIATLGIYPLYAAAQFITFSRPPWHDLRNHSQVIEK